MTHTIQQINIKNEHATEFITWRRAIAERCFAYIEALNTTIDLDLVERTYPSPQCFDVC